MSEHNIVVLGAGVVGLTTAMLLARNPSYKVTVVAKHMPGDYDIEYTSPWAGADYVPVGAQGSTSAQFEKDTWPELSRLASSVPEAGVAFRENYMYIRSSDASSATGEWMAELMKPNPEWAHYLPSFRVLKDTELPTGITTGTQFTSVTINTAVYLPWLMSKCYNAGITVKRAVVKHITDAASHHSGGKKADLVVNCTGLSALTLGGVADKNMMPARGQIVIVRNDPGHVVTVSGSDDAEDENTYIIPRPGGGGTILGGCYQKGNWDSQPDPNMANRIMKRAVEICPALTGGKGVEGLSVIRHGVGLRPLRVGGPRLEKETIDGVKCVHNYGHGGFGYQASYGTAGRAVELVDESLKSQARL